MEERVRLKVFGISYNEIRSGAYALLLSEVDGPYRIPIVVGQPEAQAIALCLEGIKPQRPLTHDLFTAFAEAMDMTMLEMYIYKFEAGVFYSRLSFSDGNRLFVIESRTSDGVAIALRARAPIFTNKEVLVETGFILETEEERNKPEESEEELLAKMSISELEALLQQLTEEEQYEEAADVSEILKKKKNNN